MTQHYPCQISNSTFLDWKAVTMETSQLRLIVIPELGGKIVSFIYLPTGKEWLVDVGSRKLEAVEHGANFEEADMSGWDECFPTIDGCPYPIKAVYENVMLPDHGDIWSIPWEASIQGNVLVCTVIGRALPYEFTRKIYFIDEQQLRFEYSVRNLGEETLSTFWTAHPQFKVTEHTQIVLPSDIKEVLCVYGGPDRKSGYLCAWPEGNADFPRSLDRIGPHTAGIARKLYVDGPVTEGWAALHESDSGEFLKLDWLPELVPYFGIWIDEGQCNKEQSVCALEPCNGFYDSLTEAARNGRLLEISPEVPASWYLDVKLGCSNVEEMK